MLALAFREAELIRAYKSRMSEMSEEQLSSVTSVKMIPTKVPLAVKTELTLAPRNGGFFLPTFK